MFENFILILIASSLAACKFNQDEKSAKVKSEGLLENIISSETNEVYPPLNSTPSKSEAVIMAQDKLSTTPYQLFGSLVSGRETKPQLLRMQWPLLDKAPSTLGKMARPYLFKDQDGKENPTFHYGLDINRSHAEVSDQVVAPFDGYMMDNEDEFTKSYPYDTHLYFFDPKSEIIVGYVHAIPTIKDSSGLIKVRKGQVVGRLAKVPSFYEGLDVEKTRHVHLQVYDYYHKHFLDPQKFLSSFFTDKKKPTINTVYFINAAGKKSLKPEPDSVDIILDAYDQNHHQPLHHEIAYVAFDLLDDAGKTIYKVDKCSLAWLGELEEPPRKIMSSLFHLEPFKQFYSKLTSGGSNATQPHQEHRYFYKISSLTQETNQNCKIHPSSRLPINAMKKTRKMNIQVWDYHDNLASKTIHF